MNIEKKIDMNIEKNAILCFRNAEQSFVRLKDVLSLWILMQLAKPFPTLYVGKILQWLKEPAHYLPVEEC
ncbi:hypothetical protein BJI55_01080, partial [Acinetobacter pittii]